MEVAQHVVEYLLFRLFKHMAETVGWDVVLNIRLLQPVFVHEQLLWIFQLPLRERLAFEEVLLEELPVLLLAMVCPMQGPFNLVKHFSHLRGLIHFDSFQFLLLNLIGMDEHFKVFRRYFPDWRRLTAHVL